MKLNITIQNDLFVSRAQMMRELSRLLCGMARNLPNLPESAGSSHTPLFTEGRMVVGEATYVENEDD